MRSTTTRTVTAPIETVWSVLTDHEGMSSWAPGLTAVLTEPGRPHRNGRGAVRRLRTPLPMPAIVEQVTEFEPGRRLAYKALAGVPLRNYAGEVELSAVPSGTRIRYTVLADQRVPVVEGLVVRAVSVALITALVRAVARAGRTA